VYKLSNAIEMTKLKQKLLFLQNSFIFLTFVKRKIMTFTSTSFVSRLVVSIYIYNQIKSSTILIILSNHGNITTSLHYNIYRGCITMKRANELAGLVLAARVRTRTTAYLP